MRFAAVVFSMLCVLAPRAAGADTIAPSGGLYGGWLFMYDLKFQEAHQVFTAWMASHAGDALGPASDAAAYLFSELARLGALESELFTDDDRFRSRKRLSPDPGARAQFGRRIGEADRIAGDALARASGDAGALFVKSLSLGLRADYAALVDKQNLAALSYTKQSRIYADELIARDPGAFDAYLGPGIENYLLSLKPAPVRLVLRMTGARIDPAKGIEDLQMTASHGRYLEPFAKLLLAVAALRGKNPERARALLGELHDRFPDNPLYSRELSRLASP